MPVKGAEDTRPHASITLVMDCMRPVAERHYAQTQQYQRCIHGPVNGPRSTVQQVAIDGRRSTINNHYHYHYHWYQYHYQNWHPDSDSDSDARTGAAGARKRARSPSKEPKKVQDRDHERRRAERNKEPANLRT